MAEYHVVSVNHIDMAFVMRKEAYAEMLEIFLERVIGMLERHPHLHFALEQVAHYRNLEQRRPDLFEKAKKLLKEGRLEFMGGMATTMETNFPNGECMVRNQGMGLRWLEENLQVTPHSGWLIDTFGLNPQVPQIMKQFGFTYVHANRFGGNKTRDMFRAEGLDGSTVVIMGRISNAPNVIPETQAFHFCKSWADIDTLFAKADELRGDLPKLVTYYIENEGALSEYYLKLTEQRQETGDWRHSTYKAYEEAVTRSGYVPPVIRDELNPEFTGTFALRTPIKTENRKAETVLLNAEMWRALLSGETDDPFEDCWWDMFHCQFHDIFTGSHEDITYKDVMERYSRVQNKALEIQNRTLRIESAEDGIVVTNSLPWDRREWVGIDASEKYNAVYAGNQKLPVCRAGEKLYFLAEVPACAVAEFTLREEESVSQSVGTGKREIRNEHLRLVLDERNGLARLEDSLGFVYMRNAFNFLEAEQDSGSFQIEGCHGNRIYASTGSITVEEAVSDAMGEHIVMHGSFPRMSWNPQNSLSWRARFSLRPDERFVRLTLTLNWMGEGTRIRLNLPTAIDGRDCYHEVPFGVKRREAYHTLPTAKGEWPVQRFAALEDGSHGVALLNKGVAGVEQIGRTLATTLIRAYPEGPWMRIKPSALSNQHGESTFEFVIMPYEGGYRDAGVIAAAQSFNQEIVAIPGKSGLPCLGQQLVDLQGKGIVLSAIKKAWDGSGDLVVRLYESEGAQTSGKLTLPGAVGAWKCDLREESLERLECVDSSMDISLSPYEILSVRITRNECKQ